MSNDRLAVLKTYKLFIGGSFPRTESGRTLPVVDSKGDLLAHLCHGSRKDLRNSVVAARKAQKSWAARAAYNRGQILYRMAEMLEGKRSEFIDAIAATCDGGVRRAEAAAPLRCRTRRCRGVGNGDGPSHAVPGGVARMC